VPGTLSWSGDQALQPFPYDFCHYVMRRRAEQLGEWLLPDPGYFLLAAETMGRWFL